ncbi:MAG: DUF4105 domain-containing protein [Pirellulales bacterium]
MLRPSNERNWSPDQAVLARAEFDEDTVTIRNVRNFAYLREETYGADYYDKTIRLADVQTIDFILVPFAEMPILAHTMLSFGMAGGDQLAVSIEIRKELGETYAAWKGGLRQYEIMYVVGDERDLVKLRTSHRMDDVYVYHLKASPELVQGLFVDMMQRVEQLAEEPEFYDTLTNNCTTNLAGHVNRLSPNRIPYGLGVLLPGYSDRLLYSLGLLEARGTFAETKRRANVSEVARAAADSPDFSRVIRR